MKVSDVMTRDVLSVEPSTPLHEVARLLVDRSISGLPVVDNGRVVGVVSEADFVDKQAHVNTERQRRLRRFLPGSAEEQSAARRSSATVAGEIMTAPAMVIQPTATLSEAARAMERNGVNRLPVVDGDQLVGIITRADIVRTYVRDDEAIAEDLTAALRAVDGISVTVKDGVAIIVGTVRAQAVVESIVHVAAAIPGVVAVDGSELGSHEAPETRFEEVVKSERNLLQS
jgi:CBS domain-containing protein